MVTDNGTFIPYKIGQTFYSIDFLKRVIEYRISGLHVKADETLKIRLTNLSSKVVFEVTENELHKRYYSEKSNAEKSLEVINIE